MLSVIYSLLTTILAYQSSLKQLDLRRNIMVHWTTCLSPVFWEQRREGHTHGSGLGLIQPLQDFFMQSKDKRNTAPRYDVFLWPPSGSHLRFICFIVYFNRDIQQGIYIEYTQTPSQHMRNWLDSQPYIHILTANTIAHYSPSSVLL